jgi:hypothetical protein
MKRLILFSAILILSLTSCKDKYQPKNIYEEKFLEYVNTDFGRPSDFIEITNADYDTVTSDKALEMLDLYRDLFFLFDKETQSKLRQMENDARNDKGMVNITFKVRMKQNRNEIIVSTFFGSYDLNNGEFMFGDNKEDFHILPKVYYDLLEFTEEFMSGDCIKTNYTYGDQYDI